MKPVLVRVLSLGVLAGLIWSSPTAAACRRGREPIQIIKGGGGGGEFLTDADIRRATAKLKRELARTTAVNQPMDCEHDCRGMTRLMVAAEQGYEDIVRTLLEAKANPDLRMPRHSASWPPHGWSARCFARAERKAGAELLLTQAGASGDADCLAEADFLVAVRKQDVKRALLLGRRAKGTLQHKVLQEALDEARRQESLAMIRAVDAAGFNPPEVVRVELLVAEGVDVSMPPGSRIAITALTPSRKAARERDEKAVLALAKAGEPPMLAMLVKQGMTSVVLRLLDAGAHPDATQYAGNTPLIEAASSRNLQLVDALLEAGADVNRPGEAEVTPLLAALRGGQPVELALVERLLKAKADINKAGQSRTPLMEAASRCLPRAVALLLRHGARWDASPDGGAVLYEEAVVSQVLCPERESLRVLRALREGGVPLRHSEERRLDWLRLRARESQVLGPELYAAGLSRPERERPGSQSPPGAVR
ncbi:ankyrin [Myxococcus stipitatus DSM 14675]|uniref:Ankyrin n=1 Tax=Myxococcus stipitatus (strain DSM 14675 / JCM 12634 / Mx s8) TaxID=1278073 RepID=L7UJ84_MYXSD|nr:ankyrin repeat domain-containing protein [Myxococcus stipitatus]AGC49041.1 ankyrin [Myxococcus stipitatus DSM 14675]